MENVLKIFTKVMSYVSYERYEKNVNHDYASGQSGYYKRPCRVSK